MLVASESAVSIVFDQTENRLWAQMALLALLFSGAAEHPIGAPAEVTA